MSQWERFQALLFSIELLTSWTTNVTEAVHAGSSEPQVAEELWTVSRDPKQPSACDGGIGG